MRTEHCLQCGQQMKKKTNRKFIHNLSITGFELDVYKRFPVSYECSHCDITGFYEVVHYTHRIRET